ncbi:desulfoferrodoxin FeS4 iron-binding domain-containing protein, partial [Peptostreptococcus porci]
MTKAVEFYKCSLCGNVVEKVVNGGGELVCCGQAMNLLKANSSDGAGEKHVPAVEVNGNVVSVKVGSV